MEEEEFDAEIERLTNHAIERGSDPAHIAKITRGVMLLKKNYDDECNTFDGSISDDSLEGMALCNEATIENVIKHADGNERFAALLLRSREDGAGPPLPLVFQHKLVRDLREARGKLAMYADIERLQGDSAFDFEL
jgi:hypothetical protein